MSFLGERNAITLGVSQHTVLSSGPLLTQLSPSLLLQFAGAQTMDPRITFTRSTTATYYDQSGVLSTAAIDAPRFDYDPATLAPLGLLVEEQRTNLLTYSKQFDDAAWTKSRVTITADAIVSPDGTVDADKLVASVDNDTHFITQGGTFTAGVAYTASIFAKRGEWGFVRIGFASDRFATTGRSACFNLNTGTIGDTQSGVTASIQNIGNGWYRCSISAVAASTGVSSGLSFNPQSVDSAVSQTIAGNGFDGIYIWGAQLEAGAFATSYIPTVASQVTRAADAASMTGTNFSSWYNATEGSVYAEWSHFTPAGFPAVFSINDGTLANRINVISSTTTGNRYGVATSGATIVDLNQADYVLNTIAKGAGAYKLNNFAATFNGATASVDTSGGVPVVTQAQFGNQTGGLDRLNGHIRQIVYYPRRLSNAQLQGITS